MARAIKSMGVSLSGATVGGGIVVGGVGFVCAKKVRILGRERRP